MQCWIPRSHQKPEPSNYMNYCLATEGYLWDFDIHLDVSKAHLEPNWKVLRPKGGLISLSLPKTKLELKSDGCINAPRHSTLPVSEDSNWVVESEKVLVYCCYDSVCFICLCTFFWLEKKVSLGVQEKVEGNLEIKGERKKKS